MSQLMVAPCFAELVESDELVSISMDETTVVVRSTTKPDAVGTQVLVDVINAATVAGSMVVLHRPGGLVDSNAASDGPPPNGDIAVEAVAAENVGIGFLEVRSEGPVWTIDVGSARFVRSDRPLDRRFLAVSDWTGFEAVWIGPQCVRALTVDGSYVAGRRALQQRYTRDFRDHRPGLPFLRHTA